MSKILTIEIVAPVPEDFVAPLELIAEQVCGGFTEGFDANDTGSYHYAVKDAEAPNAQANDDILAMYRELRRGLSDMITGGRLSESDIPDDYHWLVESLYRLASADPE